MINTSLHKTHTRQRLFIVVFSAAILAVLAPVASDFMNVHAALPPKNCVNGSDCHAYTVTGNADCHNPKSWINKVGGGCTAR